jgi:16S rRNA (cytosine1402-N4)-methyltransferase
VKGEAKSVDFSILSRVFQALRIAVNDELGSIKLGLAGAKQVLKVGGKLVVISFHSLEDRIVKREMQSGDWQVITKHPILPSEEETGTNRRSRSAKLRVATKL